MADRKRQRSEDEGPKRKKSSITPDNDMQVDEGEDLECEDPFGDDFEEENIITEEEVEAMECEDDDDDEVEKVKVWRPNVDQLGPDEQLEYDVNAYDLFHELKSDWPCLSLDIVKDNLGHQRTKVIIFPLFLIN